MSELDQALMNITTLDRSMDSVSEEEWAQLLPVATAAIGVLEKSDYIGGDTRLRSKIRTLQKLHRIAFRDQDNGAVEEIANFCLEQWLALLADEPHNPQILKGTSTACRGPHAQCPGRLPVSLISMTNRRPKALVNGGFPGPKKPLCASTWSRAARLPAAAVALACGETDSSPQKQMLKTMAPGLSHCCTRKTTSKPEVFFFPPLTTSGAQSRRQSMPKNLTEI
jgi:hypothetical protein